MEPTQTALIAAIPEAEPAVGELRARLDSSFTWGIPAHVTVFYPFLPPAAIDVGVLAAVQETVSAVPRFAVTLTRAAWFADRVLWLAPEPDEPFRALTVALARRFPGAVPYNGEFADVVPHLTVGHDHPRDVLEAAAAAVTAHLPIVAAVDSLRLIAGRPEPGGGWTTLAQIPLAQIPLAPPPADR